MSNLSKKIRKAFGKKKDESEPSDLDSFTFPSESKSSITYFSTDKNKYVDAVVPARVTVASPSLYSSSVSAKTSTTKTPSIYSNISSSSDDYDNFFKYLESKSKDRRGSKDSIASLDTIFTSDSYPALNSKSRSRSSSLSSDSSSSSPSSNNIFKNKVFTSKSDSDSDDYYSGTLSEYM